MISVVVVSVSVEASMMFLSCLGEIRYVLGPNCVDVLAMAVELGLVHLLQQNNERVVGRGLSYHSFGEVA